MNVGDYVRYKTLSNQIKINKIKNIVEPDDGELSMTNTILYDLNNKDVTADKYIIKSSPNIIELLEPMDLLYIDIDGGFEGGIVVPRIPETLNELNDFIEVIKSGHWILKGVVTHEQLENNMYKVGE